MWSIAENMNSSFWSDWIREGVDTLTYTNIAEESFVSHIPCTGSDTAPALLNNGYDLLHVRQCHVPVEVKHQRKFPGLPQSS